ncbi:phospholipase A2 inhibitor and Ly6/PLAUR domain-containing protein-like [Rana temporaria]|uniref:phospholipase A2 inhibitor and Ly6/PLAUR domain-containing protein-like n=1 Tax=Rana temporaria TaxID=8407 RepID=UPI001AADEBF5|nr:phospholipase A2 inhibitor and Ly6/PLAUR domain-containing protein-like [Rana temporaria]
MSPMASAMLSLLCVLSALTASGHALSCKVCMASFSTWCDGASVVCPAGQVCVSAYTLTTVDGSKVSEEFSRACGPTSQCNTPGSVAIPRGKIKRNTSCCFTENCFPPTPSLPEDNSELNGVTCSTCISPDSDWCHTEETMRCTGNENMCVLESSHQYEPLEQLTAIRGCATQSICDIGTQEVAYGFLNMTMKIKCSSASSPLYSPLLPSFTLTVASILAVLSLW